jgi:hypothetical protein
MTLVHAVGRAALAVMTGVFQHHALAAQPAAATSWDAFTTNFIEATFKARPHFAVWAGRHEFDGRLPDCSATVDAAAAIRSGLGPSGRVPLSVNGTGSGQ